MKKILLLFVSTLFIGASLVSCSSDDDKSGGSNAIVGKWAQVKASIESSGTVIWEGEHEHECPTMNDFIEIKDGGAGLDVYHEEDCTSYEDTFNWSRSGNMLTVTYEDEVMELEIKTLTSSSLILTYTEEDDIFGEVNVVIELSRM